MKSLTKSAQVLHHLLPSGSHGSHYTPTRIPVTQPAIKWQPSYIYEDSRANNPKRPPPKRQRVVPSKEQRVPDASDQTQRMQPTKYKRMTVGFNTMTPAAYMRVKAHDNNKQSHQPTARRLTWEDERVSAPGQNLK
jgi:hypothetical protein